MSNRTFKSLLNNQKYILFDYGQVQSFPQIDENLSGICKYNDIFYIKQRNSSKWVSIVAKTILKNVYYGNKSQQDNYDWYNDLQKNKINGNNNIMIWNHGLGDIVLSFQFIGMNQDETYSKIQMPYCILDQNNVAIDFTGFQNVWFYFIVN